MFTGLVETVGTVESIKSLAHGVLISIRSPLVFSDVRVGDSISINGCCLTAVSAAEGRAAFEAGQETLRRTNLGGLVADSSVNLERSLQVGDRLGGHFVTGHIDAVGELLSRLDDGEWSTCWFSIPAPYGHHLASKGSITIDGVSLTVVDVQASRFSVALIPHTLENTILGHKRVGDAVNLETDVLAKYVEKAVQSRTL